MANAYTPAYDLAGNFSGVYLAGSFIPQPPQGKSHPVWDLFLVWFNAQSPAPFVLGGSVAPSFRVPVPLLTLVMSLNALTTAQKAAIWQTLTGNPPLWATDTGPNAAALAVVQLLGASGSLNAADTLAAKIRAVAMYVQDNPQWLVNPGFDPTINIPGSQPGA